MDRAADPMISASVGLAVFLILIATVIPPAMATQPADPAAAHWQPPTIPVGLDAYRMWNRWPYQRIGCRAYMRSTYDRSGGNQTADASHLGSNTCYHSYPKEGELGRSQPVVQTSNRRLRDDEFLVPRELTESRTAIGVRVQFVPVDIPLLPGRESGEQAWSEIRYKAYCYVMPEVD